MLPASDLAHSAERVCVIPSENGAQPAACVAVSPEGVVRYWPNIAFESSTAEISAELRGEECAQVINFQVRCQVLSVDSTYARAEVKRLTCVGCLMTCLPWVI